MRALTLLALGAVAGLPMVARADFFEDFDTDNSANWIKLVTTGPAENQEASFAWDYFNNFDQVNYVQDPPGSGIFVPQPPQNFPGFAIPSAPHSVGGTTKGLRMRTNMFAGLLSGFSASPIGQSFLGNFAITADVWINFQGPGPGGGQGSAQFPYMGYGTSGDNAQSNFNPNGTTRDSVFFGCVTDGSSAVDYRVYADDARIGFVNGGYYPDWSATNPVPIPGIYAAGDQAGNTKTEDPYYQANFPATPIPAAQGAAYPSSQTGNARPGSLAFAWHEWKLEKIDNTLKWYVDNILMATVDLTFCDIAATPNLLVGMSDSGGSSIAAGDQAGLNSTIIDNLRVTSLGENQHVTGTLHLGDTSDPFANSRNMSYDVIVGTLTVASGVVMANSPDTPFDISIPASAVGAAQVVLDGSSFLKRKVNVSLTGSNQAVGTVAMTNGDQDQDGEVGLNDIDQVIFAYGTSDDAADLDVDGEVGLNDIDVAIAHYGEGDE